MFLKDKIVEFIAANPGKSAWTIAKGVSDDPHRMTGTISSMLKKMADAGVLYREKVAPRWVWTYRKRS